MPSFDFSNAELVNWDSGLPEANLELLNIVWEGRVFLAEFSGASANSISSAEDSQPSHYPVFRMTCLPEFAIIVEDEGHALSLWGRRDQLKLESSKLIVLNSAWVQSYRTHEPYHAIPDEMPIVHYIVGCGNDFFHLLSKEVPKVTLLGYSNEEKLHEMSAIKMVSRFTESLIDKNYQPKH
jgi:hypothetical protein